jgi:hypothetical protein
MISGYLEYEDECVSKQGEKVRIIFVENSGLAVVQTVDSMLATLDRLKVQVWHIFPTDQPPEAPAVNPS